MKTPRLSNSGIEYLDKVWNFSSGCGKGCPYCYAKKITKRFTNHYPNEFAPTLYPEALLSPLYLKKPSRIGVCYMGDLFEDCPEFNPDRKIESMLPSGVGSVRMSLKGWVFTTIKQCPQHTFLFLTKNPKRLIDWGKFPDNCFVGVSATDFRMFHSACYYLDGIEAKVKYISCEPLLERLPSADEMLKAMPVNWVIIGAQTPYSPKTAPKIEWVWEIVEACDKAGIPFFLKNNLKPMFDEDAGPNVGSYKYQHIPLITDGKLRQEMPTTKV